MRRLRAPVSLAIAFFVFLGFRSAGAGSIPDFSWLSGCWTSATPGKRQTTEHWMKPAGGTMLGVSRTIVGDQTVEYEFMRIAQEANGEIYFIAQPSGQPEARFKLFKVSASEVVFENPEHDFPQRVIYRRDGDSLLGRIEGAVNGREKSSDFPMKRVPCD